VIREVEQSGGKEAKRDDNEFIVIMRRKKTNRRCQKGTEFSDGSILRHLTAAP